LKNESFAEAGVKKSFYWTNKDDFSSETGYTYNMMTSWISKAQGKLDFSVHHPFKVSMHEHI